MLLHIVRIRRHCLCRQTDRIPCSGRPWAAASVSAATDAWSQPVLAGPL